MVIVGELPDHESRLIRDFSTTDGGRLTIEVELLACWKDWSRLLRWT